MIAAEGEQKASRALREASEVIAESSAALQLRYLQVGQIQTLGIFLQAWEYIHEPGEYFCKPGIVILHVKIFL